MVDDDMRYLNFIHESSTLVAGKADAKLCVATHKRKPVRMSTSKYRRTQCYAGSQNAYLISHGICL